VTLTVTGPAADQFSMGRSLIGLCAGFGMFIGGYVPELWGAGSFSLSSLLFGAVGGIAGVWLGARLSQDI
jgi:hypothetical protein